VSQVVVRDDAAVAARDGGREAVHAEQEMAEAELQVVEVGGGGDFAGVASAGEAGLEVARLVPTLEREAAATDHREQHQQSGLAGVAIADERVAVVGEAELRAGQDVAELTLRYFRTSRRLSLIMASLDRVHDRHEGARLILWKKQQAQREAGERGAPAATGRPEDDSQ
jgi:hypothetical protein